MHIEDANITRDQHRERCPAGILGAMPLVCWTVVLKPAPYPDLSDAKAELRLRDTGQKQRHDDADANDKPQLSSTFRILVQPSAH